MTNIKLKELIVEKGLMIIAILSVIIILLGSNISNKAND